LILSKISTKFWEEKKLEEMNDHEWESLCDGCARCCLHKFQDEDGDIHFTDVTCQFLDTDKCKCAVYDHRLQLVPGCINLTPESVPETPSLPSTCAYRLLNEGKSLPSWHPLITGTKQSVIDAGISVLGRVISEAILTPEEIEYRIVDWPNEDPNKYPISSDDK
jgi:uncharacterized protein